MSDQDQSDQAPEEAAAPTADRVLVTKAEDGWHAFEYAGEDVIGEVAGGPFADHKAARDAAVSAHPEAIPVEVFQGPAEPEPEEEAAVEAGAEETATD